jgi:2-hydroxychromene-2-carboxylate isomerase
MTAEPEVEFFYGIASRYSYLAATQIEALERETGCAVRWRPLFSGALIEMTGASPFKGSPVSGQYDWGYRRKDAERWAEFYGVPFIEPPDDLKHDPQGPKRLALACTVAASLGLVVELSRRLFLAVFAESTRDLSDQGLAAYARDAGIEQGVFLEALRDPATQQALDATTREAFERGAFGVPTFLSARRCSGAMIAWPCCSTVC